MAKASDAAVIERLYAVVKSRKGGDPDKSYVAKLHARGTAKIAQKFGEEAVEAIIAALRGKPDEIVAESADTIFHLLILLADADIEPSRVWAELERREGTSGFDEKKSRAKT
ncbi:MAG TPA: phosphoribosyl-ATP diphosphatase [Candidatus Cybelea sp.]|nr:phosphoribosyl-ATP diphosphatase [Candidatus Cybelea sp.]